MLLYVWSVKMSELPITEQKHGNMESITLIIYYYTNAWWLKN